MYTAVYDLSERLDYNGEDVSNDKVMFPWYNDD